MAELGVATESEHRRMTRVAEDLGIEVIGFQTALYGPAEVDGVDEAVALLRTMGPADAVLVKGSRVVRLEDVVRGVRIGARSSVARRGGVARRLRTRPPAVDEDATAELAVEGLCAQRRRAAGVERIDPPLAFAPLEAEPVCIALGCGELHGGAGECLAVGLQQAGALEAPVGELEVPRLGRQVAMEHAASTSTAAMRPPCPSASHQEYPDSALASGSPSTSSRAAR